MCISIICVSILYFIASNFLAKTSLWFDRLSRIYILLTEGSNHRYLNSTSSAPLNTGRGHSNSSLVYVHIHYMREYLYFITSNFLAKTSMWFDRLLRKHILLTEGWNHQYLDSTSSMPLYIWRGHSNSPLVYVHIHYMREYIYFIASNF